MLADVSPKLAPCTLMLREPVAAALLRRPLLANAESTENSLLVVPLRVPTLTVAFIVRTTPPAIRHIAPVSDCQNVLSQLLPPNRTPTDIRLSPSRPPLTVMLQLPLAARFERRASLTPARSIDKPRDSVPPFSPTVNRILRLPDSMYPTSHRTAVSDPHVVRSHADPPDLALPVYVVSPRFAPCTVTLADPVPARFVPRTTLSAANPTENARVTLLPAPPLVTNTLSDCITP